MVGKAVSIVVEPLSQQDSVMLVPEVVSDISDGLLGVGERVPH